MATVTKDKPGIDRDAIVAEALRLLNETNLAGLTMRGLADRLGIRAASLYWHFPNKAALVSAMSATLFREAIEKAPDADSWQEWLRGVGQSVWSHLICRPDSGLLIMMAAVSEEEFRANATFVRAKLAKFDLDADTAFRLHTAIQALIIGWVTFAHSPFFDSLASAMDIENSAMESLDALIIGWDRQIAGEGFAKPSDTSGE